MRGEERERYIRDRRRMEKKLKREKTMEKRETIYRKNPKRVGPPAPLQPLSIWWKTGFHIVVLT